MSEFISKEQMGVDLAALALRFVAEENWSGFVAWIDQKCAETNIPDAARQIGSMNPIIAMGFTEIIAEARKRGMI